MVEFVLTERTDLLNDRNSIFKSDLDDPASNAFAITANSNNYFTSSTRRLWVGSAGNVVVQMANPSNNVVMFSGVAAGTMLDIRVNRVLANSTANGFVGVF